MPGNCTCPKHMPFSHAAELAVEKSLTFSFGTQDQRVNDVTLEAIVIGPQRASKSLAATRIEVARRDFEHNHQEVRRFPDFSQEHGGSTRERERH